MLCFPCVFAAPPFPMFSFFYVCNCLLTRSFKSSSLWSSMDCRFVDLDRPLLIFVSWWYTSSGCGWLDICLQSTDCTVNEPLPSFFSLTLFLSSSSSLTFPPDFSGFSLPFRKEWSSFLPLLQGLVLTPSLQMNACFLSLCLSDLMVAPSKLSLYGMDAMCVCPNGLYFLSLGR